MKNRFRQLAATAVLAIGLALGASNAQAQDAQTCQPGLAAAYQAHAAQYLTLIQTLFPQAGTLIGQLQALTDQATYDPLLATAVAVATSIVDGRVLITLPDGTVVLDTSKNNNTYANFVAKAINENHNSRVAILAAQSYPCGIGLESKVSTSTGQNESYFALRAGAHLDNVGTLRISSKQ